MSRRKHRKRKNKVIAILHIARKWYYRLPIGWRKRLRRWYYFPADILKPPINEAVPPRGKNFVGPGDFEAIGKEYFGYFKKWGNIKPESRILEIGCGMGRMALPFKDFLSEEGQYTGIDIVPEGIAWCEDEIAPDDPRFIFILADIRNKLYNPYGETAPEQYVFPLPDNSHDLIFLTSVFTHLLPATTAHYLEEISGILKPGGRIIASIFLLNPQSRALLAEKKGQFRFREISPVYSSTDTKLQESNIAYDEKWVTELIEKYGLQLAEPIQYGSWCGRKQYLSFQDILILTKP